MPDMLYVDYLDRRGNRIEYSIDANTNTIDFFLGLEFDATTRKRIIGERLNTTPDQIVVAGVYLPEILLNGGSGFNPEFRRCHKAFFSVLQG